MAELQRVTPKEEIPQIVATLRQQFHTGITRSYEFRRQQLKGLLRFLETREAEIEAALKTDLCKCKTEVIGSEIGLVVRDIKIALKNLSRWMKPKKVKTHVLAQPGKTLLYPEPYGVILIISPWNYPILLPLGPIVGALAAGNAVVLKPSELSGATSELLARELPQFIASECLQIITGGPEVATAVLEEKFDYILYVGNPTTAKIVMSAAARDLTPITLELGGKSPCIVDNQTDLMTTARRIAWGKFSNAGQICLAPDYVLVMKSVADEFLRALKTVIHQFYGDHPELSPEYGRIINQRHFTRLINLLPSQETIYHGGNYDEATRYIAPTILYPVTPDDPIMQNEIFGPILPVITIESIDEAIQFINARPKPLAVYIFSSNQQVQDTLIRNTSSGTISINFPLLQLASPDMPFGGIGNSGMGVLGGKHTFDTFTHYKGVLKKPIWGDLSLFYPPYTALFNKILRWLR